MSIKIKREVFERKLQYVLSRPDVLIPKLNKLFWMIMNHPLYESKINENTKFTFEFACIGGFWALRDIVLYTVNIWYQLNKT
jgi:hypothetical protein